LNSLMAVVYPKIKEEKKKIEEKIEYYYNF
jgi:hypothetical protein